MTKYHYTYRITNMVEQKHYYGARSSNIHPTQDLGKKYFSSSSNKEFLAEQISSPENFKYKVIKIFETREEAIALEIKLHAKFNVSMNESFYNKAKQTSTGFDTAGMYGEKNGMFNRKHSDEAKKKMSDFRSTFKESEETKKKKSESKKGEKNNMFNKKHSEETKKKISDRVKKLNKNISEEEKNRRKNINKGRKHSDETKKKISERTKGENHPLYGIGHSTQSKEKMSNAKLGKKFPLITCPHCGKKGGGSGMTRFHFDNCKFK